MGKSNKVNYCGVKGQFINDKMKSGRTNQQARNDWKRSPEAKSFSFGGSHLPGPEQGVNIDRSYSSPWQDYAHTSDDI